MNSCLKVVQHRNSGSLQIHAPCAVEQWRTNQSCAQGDSDYKFLEDNYKDPNGRNESVHELDCSEFRLNN